MSITAVPLRAFAGYGIELEYAIVARDGLDVRPLADRLLERMAGAPAADVVHGAFGWSNELVRHVVEVKNVAPAATLAGMAQGFQGEIAKVEALLDDDGAALMPTGMHPWMSPRRETVLWTGEARAIYAAFDRIFDCRRHGWANLQSMHVNLPFGDDAEFVRLHAAIRAVLPLVPALAASSPLVDGRRAAALDARLEAYRTNSILVPAITGAVIPEDVGSRAEYEQRILAPMYRAIAPHDREGVLRHEWLNARGAIARFDRDAIEIRLADVQECPQADLAIAAALAAAVRALYEERWQDLAALRTLAVGALAEVLAACVRDAGGARIGNAAYLAAFGLHAPRRARDVWAHVLAATEASVLALEPAALGPLRIIQEHGTLAERIVAAAGDAPHRGRLHDVYARLCACLAHGTTFTGDA